MVVLAANEMHGRHCANCAWSNKFAVQESRSLAPHSQPLGLTPSNQTLCRLKGRPHLRSRPRRRRRSRPRRRRSRRRWCSAPAPRWPTGSRRWRTWRSLPSRRSGTPRRRRPGPGTATCARSTRDQGVSRGSSRGESMQNTVLVHAKLHAQHHAKAAPPPSTPPSTTPQWSVTDVHGMCVLNHCATKRSLGPESSEAYYVLHVLWA